jgi:osmotically-inducible protein OsmY
LAHRSLGMTFLMAAFACASAAPLGGCLVAAGAAAGAGGGYALSQERSLSDMARDAGIHAAIAQSWKDYNLRMSEDIDTVVYEGRVLITGTVPSEDWRAEAVKRAWKVDGVKEVYDEIQVGPEEGFMQDMGDATITSKLKAQMIADADVKSINYTVTTVKHVIYVIGTARSQAELNRVVDHARNIANVRRVVSYVRIRTGEPAPTEAARAPSAAPPPASAPPPPAAAASTSEPISTPTPRQSIEVTPLK